MRFFYLGLFAALVYHRQNLVLISPFFVAAMLLTEFSWQSAVLAATPVLIFGAAYYIHYLFKKKLRILNMLAYSAVSQIPIFFIYGTSTSTLINSFFILIGSILFAYCCIIFGYAVFVRGMRYRATARETTAGGILLLAVSLGLYCIGIKGVTPFYFVVGAAVTAACFCDEKCVAYGIIVGLGASLAHWEPQIAAMLAVCTLCGYGVRRLGCYVIALTVVIVEVIFSLALGLFADYGWINSLLFAVSAGGFCLLPDKVKNSLLAFAGTGKGYAARTIVNRNRLDLYSRLTSVGKVLNEMENTLLESMASMPPAEENKNYLAKEVSRRLCGACEKKSSCERELGTTTASAVYDLVDSAVTRGRATIVDVPPFFAGKCPNVPTLLKLCGEIAGQYGIKKEISDAQDSSKLMMSEQVSGIAGVLNALAADVKKIVSFELDMERRLTDALSEAGIIASEAVIYSDNRELFNVITVVREKDADKPSIAGIIGSVLGCPVVPSTKSNYTAGMVSLSFVTSPAFDMLVGRATTRKAGSGKSGDTKSVTKLSPEKLMLAICDGMGSGEKAMKESSCALGLVESFYKAGIEDTVVLSLINKLLNMRNTDSFQALDMGVINLRTGAADIIKLGAPQSLIRRKEGFEIIEGASLPIGILDSVKPSVTRKILSDGDMLVLVSDGITEAVGIEGVARIVEQNKVSNPQMLADLILSDASQVWEGDDMTVLCARLYKVIGRTKRTGF